MNEVAGGELIANEIEEKLEYLANDHRQHIKLHKLKASTWTVGEHLSDGIT
jgi:hypothetical protein